MEFTLAPVQPPGPMQNDRPVDPSPRVRRKKRKSGDLLVMSPELSFVCDISDGEDDVYCYKDGTSAMRELRKSNRSSAPMPSEMKVTYEPLRDSSVSSNKKSKMNRTTSMPRLSDLVHSEQSALRAVVESSGAHLQIQNHMNVSASAPSLQDLGAQHEQQSQPISGSPYASTNPDKHLHKVLKELGMTNVQTRPALDQKDFFFENTDANINSYSPDIVATVRRGDVAKLREMHRDGCILQSCNKFGESILHAACRRGAFNVVQFLLDEAQIEVRLRDDYGRTPLHDACWTREPEKEIMQLLIAKCPDMLLMTDKRGFTPLAYVRKAHWGQWCEFLDANRHLLKPTEL